MYFIKHKKAIREEESGIIAHIIHVLDYPLHIIRQLTIPPVEEENYNHFYLVIWPYLGLMFLVYSFFHEHVEFYFYSIPLAFLLSYVFYKYSE